MTGNASFTKELHADHMGTGDSSLSSSSLGASWPVRVQDTIQVAFSPRMFWGNSCSDGSSNVGYAGEGGLDGSSTHGIKDVSDLGRSVTEGHETFGSSNLKNEKQNTTTATYETKCCSTRGSFLSYILEMRLAFNLLASLIETEKNLNHTDQSCQSKRKIKRLLSN